MTDEQLAARYPTMNAAPNVTAQAAGGVVDTSTSSDDTLAQRYNAPGYQPSPTSSGIDNADIVDLESHREIGLAGWYETLELSPEQRAETTSALQQVAGDWGLGRQEIGQVVSALHSAAREPVDAATERRWGDEVERRLRAAHGDTWRNALDDARRLVAQKPEIAQILHETRVGSHPQVVMTLVEKARALRLKGVL